VQTIDRAIDPGRGLGRVAGHEVRDVLEREPDRIDALDDPVVEVATDPEALVDDRQLLNALVKPGVLDRDAGVDREHLDELLVLRRELARSDLLGQVEVADRPSRDPNRNAEERIHRRMVRREPVAVGGGCGSRESGARRRRG